MPRRWNGEKEKGGRHMKHVKSGRLLLPALAWLFILLLAACAVEIKNKEAAQEIARLAKPTGSVYTGWRVFQDKCAGCHGTAATGTARAPDLLPIVREIGVRQFIGLVLTRYDWTQVGVPTTSDSAARAAQVERIVQRQDGAMTMPAWQDEPRVNAHIMDLYAYLIARVDGVQGPQRPPQ